MRIIAIILALSFLSCTSSQNRDACCKEQGPNVAIEHTITYTRKGSRSETRHGHLIINGWELPDVFTYVICGDRVYKFYQRTNLWGRDGYFPQKKSESEIPTNNWSKNSIRESDLLKGWYMGDKRLLNTPFQWIHVKWGRGNAHVSPEKLKHMLSDLKIERIPRSKHYTIKNKNR